MYLTDYTVPIEKCDEETEFIPATSDLCCCCLKSGDQESTLSAEPQAALHFESLIGRVNLGLALKFCSNCVECLNCVSEFKQTCVQSVEFISKIQAIDVLDEKIDDSYFMAAIKMEETEGGLNVDAQLFESEQSESAEEESAAEEDEEEIFEKPKRMTRKRKARHKKQIKVEKDAGDDDEKLRYCGICQQYFKNVLMPHIFDCHIKDLGDDRYHCLICDHILSQKSTLKFHFESHNTTDKPLTCNICAETFNQKRAFVKHCQKHQKYECEHCNRKLSTKSRLREHILTQHTDAKKCSYCSEVFYDEAEYAEHQKLERERREKAKDTIRRVCDICGFNASCGPALSAHKERRQ